MALKQGFFIFLATLVVVATFFQFATHTSKETDELLEHGASPDRESTPQGTYFVVTAVRGQRETTTPGAPLDTLLVQASLSPRSSEADLSKVAIELSDGPNHRELLYSPYKSDDGAFMASLLRNTGNTYTPASPILARGDLVEIEIDLKANDLPIGPRQAFFIDLVYDDKWDVTIEFVSPPSFAGSRVFRLL